jgi:hypothetical protein
MGGRLIKRDPARVSERPRTYSSGSVATISMPNPPSPT